MCAFILATFLGFQPVSTAFAGGIQSWFGGETADAKRAPAYKPTRFVIGLPSNSKFQVFSLSKPNRVIVELPNIKLRLPRFTRAAAAGLVKSYRSGRSGPGKSRVVIDVKAPVVVESAQVEKTKSGKYQLALTISPLASKFRNSKRTKLKYKPFGLGGGALAQPPTPRRAVHPDELAARAFKPTIVIDPGHGGHDSGAKKYGTVEKNVVLKFGLKLRDALEATGRYRVLMTRDNDEFISLDGRRKFAERHNAHLFIAVHADYARSSARGATIYSLRPSVARRLKSSARRNVARKILTRKEMSTVTAANGNVGAVNNILADLAQREVEVTSARSSMFARSVIEYMGDSTKLRSHPDKSAAFRVLKTAKFPSVLIELAFVSNRKDAALLRSDEWRNKVSNSIVTAVDNYFSAHEARLPL